MRDTILIADDEEINRDLLKEVLKDDFRVATVADGNAAIEYIKKHSDRIAVLMLDIVMPQVDGFEVLRFMTRENYIGKIPVLIISGDETVAVERDAFNYGASDFIRKPFDSVIVRQRVMNVADLFMYKNSLEDQLERQVDKLKLQAEALRLSKLKIIDVLGAVVESRNLESGEHIQRVKQYTWILAKCVRKLFPEYGLDDKKIGMITAASSLHDIGKIAIPDSILLKPGRLTDEEFAIMKTHTIKGCAILDSIQDALDEDYGELSYEICRYHHEKADGRGYPDGLKGDEIPISAQLVSVADVYDALVNERCYKSAFSKQKAYEMIKGGECGAFSDKLMAAFDDCREEFENV